MHTPIYAYTILLIQYKYIVCVYNLVFMYKLWFHNYCKLMHFPDLMVIPLPKHPNTSPCNTGFFTHTHIHFGHITTQLHWMLHGILKLSLVWPVQYQFDRIQWFQDWYAVIVLVVTMFHLLVYYYLQKSGKCCGLVHFKATRIK